MLARMIVIGTGTNGPPDRWRQQIIDTVRAASYGSWIMFRDLRYGVRMLLRAKGWTAVVVISLALGIGANTALFSAVNGLLLKKILVRDPDTLVRLRGVGRNQMATSSSIMASLIVRHTVAATCQCGRRSRFRCTSNSAPATKRCRICSHALRSGA